MTESRTSRLYATVAALLFSGFIVAVCIFAVGQDQARQLGRKLSVFRGSLLQGVSWQHPLEFIGYEPSAWEQEVLGSLGQLTAQPELVCNNSTTSATTKARLQTWLNTTAYQSDSGTLQLDTDVFSRLRSRDPTTGQEVVTYIEPLVRHFRYLFDLGTGLYPTGLTWFVENYGRRGVVFDEIWVFKLDIDNDTLERSIFRQVLQDPQLVGAIAEMMYEMHYDHPDMRPWFGGLSGQWEEVLRTFVQARQAGIRLHYWP